MRAEARNLSARFHKLQQILQRQSVTCLEKFLQLEADSEIFQREHAFRLIVGLTHWRDILQFAAPAESKRSNVVKVKGFLFWNRMSRGKADATVSLKDGCLFVRRELTFECDCHAGEYSELRRATSVGIF